jgi:hypothetical protein
MALLDIAGSGLFGYHGGFFHMLGSVFKLGAGGVAIFVLTIFGYIGSIIYSIYKGFEAKSILHGCRTLIQMTGYVMGASAALTFALVASIFFGIPALTLLFVTVVIGFAVSFIARETLLFMVLKKFGTYIMALTAFEWIKELVLNHGEQETGA